MTDLERARAHLLLPVTEPRIIATIDAKNGYDGMIAAMLARLAETGMNYSDVDRLSNLAHGHTSKLLGDARPKQIGMGSFLAISATLGICWDGRIDPEQEALMRPHWSRGQDKLRRNKRLARLGQVTIKRVLPEVMRDLGKRGSAKLTPSQRMDRARKAGKASGRARLRKGLMEAAMKPNILNVGRSKRDKGA